MFCKVHSLRDDEKSQAGNWGCGSVNKVYKHEDLSLDPQNQGKIQAQLIEVCNPDTEDAGTEGSLKLPGQPG